LTDEDLIRNRACNGIGPNARVGDKALASLLLFHSVAMNGGVFHALELLTSTELSDALKGYQKFGLSSFVDIILKAQHILNIGDDYEIDATESKIDNEYFPIESLLFLKFKQFYKRCPLDFEPLENNYEK